MKCFLTYKKCLPHTSGFVFHPTENIGVSDNRNIFLFNTELSLETKFYIPQVDEDIVVVYKTIKRRLKLL